MRRRIIAICLIALLGSVARANAATIGVVANESGNSLDFAAIVTGMGGSITDLDFETAALGALDPNLYSSIGITFSGTGGPFTVANNAGPGDGNNITPPNSTGEGVHASSKYVVDSAFFSSSGTFVVSFDQSVLGAGLFLVDLFNPGGVNDVSLAAYTGVNGTGTLLGTFSAEDFNFQNNFLYFMGIVSTDNNIRSIALTNLHGGGDTVGYDNLRFATLQDVTAVPEPASMLLLGSGLAAIAAKARRRSKRQNQ